MTPAQQRAQLPAQKTQSLRIYPGSQGSDPPPILPTAVGTPDDLPNQTIDQVWEHHFRPHLVEQRRAKDTIQSYSRYVKAWLKFWSQQTGQDGIVNPVLAQITGFTLKMWRSHLIQEDPDGAGFSNRNANKYVGGIEAMLAFCESAYWRAPKLKRLPEDGPGLKYHFRFLHQDEIQNLQELQYQEDANSKSRSQEIQSKDQLSAAYRASEVAWWPVVSRGDQELDPVDQWRTAMVLFATYGFRTEELINYSGGDTTSLRWNQVTFEPQMPMGVGHCENQHGWLWYLPQKQKRVKKDPLVLPLNACTAWHLKSIRPKTVTEDQPVFDWPRNSDMLYKVWHSIIGASKIKLPVDRQGKTVQLTIKHLRKTCVTWQTQYSSPTVAGMISGHANRDVLNKHYLSGDRLIIDAVNKLPVPAAWAAGMKHKTLTQRKLF